MVRETQLHVKKHNDDNYEEEDEENGDDEAEDCRHDQIWGLVVA